ATSYMAVGFYVAKYVNKKSDMDLAAKGLGAKEWNNSLKTKLSLLQELDAVIHLLMEAKHWGLRKSRNATSLNSRFKSLDTLKVKIISVTFRRVIRTNHKKASKIWRHENIQLGGCQS